MAKPRYCQHCQRVVTPIQRTRGASGCLLFLVSLVIGVGMLALPDVDNTLVAVSAAAWWLGGFVLWLVMAHGKAVCPMCGLPAKDMRGVAKWDGGDIE